MLLITSPFGLASLLTTELKRLKYSIASTFPTGCRVKEDTPEVYMTINLLSRLGNKVYLELGQKEVREFEDLFQLTLAIDRSQFIGANAPFAVRAVSTDSKLASFKTIQSIVHKAIVTKLTGDKDVHRCDDGKNPLEVFVFIEKDIAHLCINTSGAGLHERHRRVDQGKAPIKENLAVATLLLASRPFHQPLRDPCCGSGTMIIEAARLARNIPSGNLRRFDFQRFPCHDGKLFATLKEGYSKKLFQKDRTLLGTDIDPRMIDMARRNAKHAGVEDIVSFEIHDVLSKKLPAPLEKATGVTIVSNPPYDKRLKSHLTDDLHHRLGKLIEQEHRNGAIISGYDHALQHFPLSTRKRKETRNGKEVCYIWTKKGT